MLFQTKAKKKWPASSSALLLLVSCLTNTLNLSRLSYICQEHGLYLTLLPWFQLLHGAGHVFTVYIMGCWEKRGRTGVLVPFGATFKCVRLCVFLMLQAVVSSSQANAESKRPYEGMVITTPTLIGWDVPWMPSDHGHMVKQHECISVCCMSRLLIIDQDENNWDKTTLKGWTNTHDIINMEGKCPW